MSERLPSKQKALNFLVQSGCTPQVIRHCEAVTHVAKKIAIACKRRGLNVDMELIKIGALLHDIGRSRTHSVNHVIMGVEVATSLGLPRSVVSIIQCHTGINMDEAEKLGWPLNCYLPQTIEEKIVSYADKLIEGSMRVKIEKTIEKLSRELGSTHSAIKRLKKLHEEFSSLIGDLDNLAC